MPSFHSLHCFITLLVSALCFLSTFQTHRHLGGVVLIMVDVRNAVEKQDWYRNYVVWPLLGTFISCIN
jgi:hypothetical protein